MASPRYTPQGQLVLQVQSAKLFDLFHGFSPALLFHDALSVGFYRASYQLLCRRSLVVGKIRFYPNTKSGSA